MKKSEALQKLPEYLADGLDAADRLAIEKLVREDSEFADAFHLSERIEAFLGGQNWLAPSSTFTRNVLSRALTEAPRPLPAWVRMWEPTKIGVSFFTVGLLLALSGKTLLSMGTNALHHSALWLDMITGSRVFELNPLFVLAIVLPVAVGGWATCIILGRCRVMS